MDPHFRNITIALYEHERDGAPQYIVHSYSRLEGAQSRVDFVASALAVLAGLETAEGRLRFACGALHDAAIRRAFLEACKLPPGAVLSPRPLAVLDKKLDRTVTASGLGPGLYELSADGPPEAWVSRVESIAAGLLKLAQLESLPGEPRRVRFSCGRTHDALIGLLLPRALNVRAFLREEEMAASRGVLAAPSARK